MLDHETRHRIRHAISEARKKQLAKIRQGNPGNYCLGCGTHKNHYTAGCTNCNDRRRRRNKTAESIPCLECGARILRNTMRRRAQRGWASANIQKCRACLHATCAACGRPNDQYTVGCGTCRSRHHKRLLEHRKQEAA